MEVAKNHAGLVLPGCQPVYNPMFGQWLYKNKKMYEDLKAWMPKFHETGSKIIRSADRRVRTVFHGQRADGDTLHKQISEGGFQTVYGSG